MRDITEIKKLIVITGPTASGKTRRAVSLAKAINGEIISADSRQVYTGMDLGTGKDTEEYGDVSYHLIDVVPAGSKYNLYRYLYDAGAAETDIRHRGKNCIMCGGTGLYVESYLNGLRLPEVPENKELRKNLEGKSLEELTAILSRMKNLHNTTDIDTAKRAIRAIEIQTFYENHPEASAGAKPSPREAVIIGVDISREKRREKITQRLQQRLDSGMIDEVKRLLESGIPADDLIYYGLEYKFLTLHVLGSLSYAEMFTALETAIHQFAKRQMTWFRGMERRGFHINWLSAELSEEDFTQRAINIINEQ